MTLPESYTARTNVVRAAIVSVSIIGAALVFAQAFRAFVRVATHVLRQAPQLQQYAAESTPDKPSTH